MLTSFLYLLAGGMMLVTATGRPEQIAWRFLRLIGCLVLAMASLVTVWSIVGAGGLLAPRAGWSVRLGFLLAAASMVVILAAPFAPTMPRVFRSVCGVGGACGVAAGVLSSLGVFGREPPATGVLTAWILAQALSALFVGGITVAWLLGHAYLTATRMTIAPLRHFGQVLVWVVGARFLFLALSLLLAVLLRGVGESAVFPALAGSGMVKLILLLRVGVGLVAVSVFAYMVRECIKLRSTQSATGILYFGSGFAYVGELANQYLVAESGWPM